MNNSSRFSSACLPLFAAWVLAALLPAQTKESAAKELGELRPKINAAIDRGVAFLIGRQDRDGSFEGDERRYPLGQTALCVYTLLKSGVSKDHPAVRRGLAYLKPRMPEETYSAACVLMALEATHDPIWRDKIQAVAARLLQWQVRGIFSYPKQHTEVIWPDEPGAPDLSNTQFAALGMRAAAKAGVKIRNEAWIALAEATFPWQQEKGKLVDFMEDGYKRSVPAAGFRYRNDKNAGGKFTRDATGSMTCAGIGVLLIVKEQLGAKASRGFAEKIRASTDQAVAWLSANWDIEKNPGEGEGWWIYYLYGLERVGALLGTEEIGPYRWYLEGARILLKKQGGSGDWPASGRVHADTCFALLFLERATAGTTGGDGRRRPTVASEAEDSDVRFRVQGGVDGSALAMFVTSFGPAALSAHGGAPGSSIPGLRVLAAEWTVNGAVVATAEGDPRRAWRNDALAATFSPQARGKISVNVRVSVVAADAPHDGKTAAFLLEGKPVELVLAQVFEPWMEDSAEAELRNVIDHADVQAEATISQNESRGPAKAFDGLQSTGWYFAPGDGTPALTAVFGRAPKADALVLSQANGRTSLLGGHDVITKIRLSVNGGPPVEHELAPDELTPTRIPLGGAVAVRKLKIEIIARTKGTSWPGFGGIAEIALELSSRK